MPEKYISRDIFIVSAHEAGSDMSFNIPNVGLFNANKGDYVGTFPEFRKTALTPKNMEEKYVPVKIKGEHGDLAITLLEIDEKNGKKTESGTVYINPKDLNFKISIVEKKKKKTEKSVKNK